MTASRRCRWSTSSVGSPRWCAPQAGGRARSRRRTAPVKEILLIVQTIEVKSNLIFSPNLNVVNWQLKHVYNQYNKESFLNPWVGSPVNPCVSPVKSSIRLEHPKTPWVEEVDWILLLTTWLEATQQESSQWLGSRHLQHEIEDTDTVRPPTSDSRWWWGRRLCPHTGNCRVQPGGTSSSISYSWQSWPR